MFYTLVQTRSSRGCSTHSLVIKSFSESVSLFLQSFSLALRSNDQFKASPWSTLFFFVFFGRIGGATRWRVCYQQGLPRLVSGIIQNPIVSVWYYHMPFSVMLKHKWCTVFFTACRVQKLATDHCQADSCTLSHFLSSKMSHGTQNIVCGNEQTISSLL